MLSIIRQMLWLLTPHERKQAYWCFAAMLIMAIIDVIGVASIMPFIAVIADPDAILHHAKLAYIYNQFNFTNAHSFLIFLGLLVLGILVVGNAVSMFTTWAILSFTYARQYSLSERLFVRYISQPYVFFLNRNASELGKNILSEITTVINRAFIPGMQLIAKGIIAVLILALLLIVDPVLAFVVTFILGGAYLAIYFKVRWKLSIISKRCIADNSRKFKITTEAMNGIKDIKILGRESYFIERFSKAAKQHANDEKVANIIAQLPRFALETIAFGGVLVIILYLLIMKKNIANVMPILALYAFASLRLMPALQQIFNSITFLKVSKDALNILTHDLHNLFLSEHNHLAPTRRLNFDKQLEIEHLIFKYPNTNNTALNDMNLRIPVNSTVGFVGMTGAGKTTLIDIILGLLTPTSGTLSVDDVLLTEEKTRAWQQRIGYVPQSIYLSDDTVAKNIAFGVPEKDIDMQGVINAAKLANIHQFIMSELGNGYETLVGDKGLRLSGGQRQRIGIARALYHQPSVLVMDEATNALDTMTETIIMDAIQLLKSKKTIIIIAHKLSTLKECDLIYVLDHGKIGAIGKYHELILNNERFRELAGVEKDHIEAIQMI